MLLLIAYFYPLTLVPESKAELSLHFLELEMQNFAFIRRILFCGISSVTPEKWSYLTARRSGRRRNNSADRRITDKVNLHGNNKTRRVPRINTKRRASERSWCVWMLLKLTQPLNRRSLQTGFFKKRKKTGYKVADSRALYRYGPVGNVWWLYLKCGQMGGQLNTLLTVQPSPSDSRKLVSLSMAAGV